jgi:hypothetical protein
MYSGLSGVPFYRRLVEDCLAFHPRPPDVAPSSKLWKAMSGRPGGYVGQDTGELSRVAVLEFSHSEWWSGGVANGRVGVRHVP